MQPTLARPPFHRSGWVYEEKVDGWRILAHKDGDRVRLISRNGVIHTLVHASGDQPQLGLSGERSQPFGQLARHLDGELPW